MYQSGYGEHAIKLETEKGVPRHLSVMISVCAVLTLITDLAKLDICLATLDKVPGAAKIQESLSSLTAAGVLLHPFGMSPLCAIQIEH